MEKRNSTLIPIALFALLAAPSLKAATKAVQNSVIVTLDAASKSSCRITMASGSAKERDGIVCKFYGANKTGANKEIQTTFDPAEATNKNQFVLLQPGQTAELTFAPNVPEDGSKYVIVFTAVNSTGKETTPYQYIEYKAEKPVSETLTLASKRWIILTPGAYRLDGAPEPDNQYLRAHEDSPIVDNLKKAFTAGKGDGPGTLKISF